MPTAKSITAAGASATKKESKSSATQLANFGVRLAKFTHNVAYDTAADFSSNLTLPSTSVIIGVGINVITAYNGTTVTADIKAGGSTIITTPTSVASTGIIKIADTALAQQSGEISIDFNNVDSTAGEMTVAVAYIDIAKTV